MRGKLPEIAAVDPLLDLNRKRTKKRQKLTKFV